jgi:hypothetical protein
MPLGNPPDLILFDNAVASGNSLIVGNGQQMRYGNGLTKPNQNQFKIKAKLFLLYTDTATGGTATYAVQGSNAIGFGAPTTIVTLTALMGAVAPFYKGLGTNNDGFLLSFDFRYLRVVLTLAGATAPSVSGFVTWGTFGA